jgi:hypothetical protein
MSFPTIHAQNLEGREFTLPAGLEGEQNVVLIAFQRHQRQAIDSWLPLLTELSQANPAFKYYELPTIDRGNPVFRWWLDNTMRAGIPDKQARASTITLYLDKKAFRTALQLPDEERIYLLLINREGKVLLHIEGPWTEAKGHKLKQVIGLNS